MPLLNRDGVNLHYEVHGSGRALILSHGFSANCTMWYGQLATLSKYFKVILWDMRGHGQSDYPDDQASYTEIILVHDIHAILNEVIGQESKALVGGLSLGGYMSLAYYKHFPDRVTALMIIDSTPGISDKAERDAWNERINALAGQMEDSGVSLLALMASTPERKRSLTHRNVNGLIRAARGVLAQHTEGLADVLPRVKCPTLVLVGEDDEQFVPTTELMAKTIPGATHVVIPDAGHAVNFDQPEVFEKELMDFLIPFSAAQGKL